MPPLLEVKGISKTYHKTHKKAVDHVSFQVHAGDIVAFLGPNGAGKTTTLKMILNLILPDQGQTFFNGQDVTHKSLPLLKETSALLESSKNIFLALSPLENFVYWGGQRGLGKREAQERGLALLKRFNLLNKKDTTIERLSRGMQQIVGICCAMIASPKLLILDEPTLGMDAQATHKMIKMLQSLAHQGVGILITTHQLDFAQQAAQQIFLINHGRLVFANSVKASLENLNRQTVFVVQFKQALTTTQEQPLLTTCNIKKEQGATYLITVKDEANLSQVLQDLGALPVEKINTKVRDLNDIFAYYAGQGK